MNENNPFYCSFVSVQYLICDCGENFNNEEELRDHLENDTIRHLLKLQEKEEECADVIFINEYKCGTCEEIFSSAEECMEHQNQTHVSDNIIRKDKDSHIVKREKEKNTVIKEKESIIVKNYDQSDVYISKIKQETLENTYNEYEEHTYYQNPPIRVQSIPLKIKKENNDDTLHTMIAEGFKETEPLYPLVEDEVYRFIPRDKYLASRGHRVPVRPEVLQQRIERKKKKPDRPEPPKFAICEVCGKNYTSNVALRYHQRVHTGVRPYPCHYCDKRFTMPLFQQIHMRIHTGERPYECTQCPKAFSNKAALLRHNRVHTGEKPYECPKCGKTFSQSNSMKLHVTTVHLRLPAPYKSKKRQAEAQARDMQVYETEDECMSQQIMALTSDDVTQDSEILYCVEVAVGDTI